MCTTGKDKTSTKEAESTLCILSGIQIPLRVEVLGQENEYRQLWRVKLCTEDLRTVRDEHSQIIQSQSFDIVVPGKCLIPSVSLVGMNPDKSKQPTKKIFGDYYSSCALANANMTDVVVWAPPLHYSRTELIPCTLYFTGFDVGKPSEAYAFVCPLKCVPQGSLAYKGYISNQKIKGWGSVFKAPISDIYRWEAINKKRLQVETELDLDTIKSSPNESMGKRTYTFVYRQRAAETEQNPTRINVDLSKVVYPEFDKEVENLQKVQKSLDGETSGDNKGKYVTRMTIGEKPSNSKMTNSVKDTEPSESENQNDPLLNRKSFADASREDGRSEIPGGSVAKAKRQFSKDEFPELHKASPSTSRSSSRDTKRSSSFEYNDSNVALFGKCFVKEEERFEKVMIDEIESGDMVVASPKYHDDIIGKVGLICKIPSIRQELIFVGVVFEEKINVSPFEVRHIFEDEDKCQHYCKKGNHVFIPLEFLLEHHGHPTSEKRLRVLKDTTKSGKKKNKETISTSDIHVDFQYEAARRDFVQTPIDLTKLSAVKLKHMGIQGNANSCYIDAVLFALYSFTSNFDEGLLKQQSYKRRKDDYRIKLEAARNLLKYDIVTPLRCALKVDWVHVYKLRRVLADILDDKSYLGKFMDAEHFIASLFTNVLQVPAFFEIGEDTKEYVLQLFPPMTPEGQDPEVNRPSVQYLLQEYCNWAEIKLRTLPQTGFLIKLPVCDGVRQYKMVYPNLTLNLDTLLDEKDQAKNFMVLRSVICFKKNHFTCFVRTNSNTPTWLFHDSMATELGESIVTECDGLEEGLRLMAPIFDKPSEKVDSDSLSKEVKNWLDKLLSTAYICVYEPPYLSTQI